MIKQDNSTLRINRGAFNPVKIVINNHTITDELFKIIIFSHY